MNEEDKNKIFQKIKQEILDTKVKIKEYSELSKPISPENAIGRISRMDAINNKSVVEAALRESEKKLDDLKYIESQINEKDFGLCIKCKTSIPIGRILFRPQSKDCVNCAK
jgi:DnaK suppressor protein